MRIIICANLLGADSKGKEPRVHTRGFLIIEAEIIHEICHLWET